MPESLVTETFTILTIVDWSCQVIVLSDVIWMTVHICGTGMSNRRGIAHVDYTGDLKTQQKWRKNRQCKRATMEVSEFNASQE